MRKTPAATIPARAIPVPVPAPAILGPAIIAARATILARATIAIQIRPTPANNAFTDPTNQTAVTAPIDLAAQQAHDAITTPWGGIPSPVALGNASQPGPGGNPVPGGPRNPGAIPVPPTTGDPSPHRAQVHAVIVSNLSDPSQVLSGNVDLTGGIIALGPLPLR